MDSQDTFDDRRLVKRSFVHAGVEASVCGGVIVDLNKQLTRVIGLVHQKQHELMQGGCAVKATEIIMKVES